MPPKTSTGQQVSALSLNWPRGTTPNLDRVTSGLLGDDLRSGGRPGAASGLGHGKAFLGGGGLPHSWLLSFLPKHKTAAADAEPAARWRYVQRAGCWFAVWAMLHTRARGADCLSPSIRGWEEVNSAAAVAVLERARPRPSCFLCLLPPSQNLCQSGGVRSSSCFSTPPELLGGFPLWICISLSSWAVYT